MNDYLEWKDDSGRGPVVRVHRRVLAGLEHESEPEFRGILLGSPSAEAGEIAVEDYAPLPPGAEFDPRTGAIAGQRRHSLTPLGYFRIRRGQGLLLDENDRETFNRWFPSPESILLLFERQGPRVDWADVYVQRGVAGRPEPVEPAALREPEVEPVKPVRAGKPRYLWPAVAAGAALLIVGAAYLAADRDVRRNDTAASAAKPRPPLPEWKPVPAPAPTATPGPPVAAPPGSTDADRSVDGGHDGTPESKAQTKKEIRAVLDRWRDSLLANDVDSYVNLYAPSVGPYFRENRVNRGQIADEVHRMLNRYGALTSYKISDVTIAPVDENHAIANFRKDWRTAHNAFAGAEKAQLRFVRENGQWLIASEQELRVYWARKR